MNESKLAAPRPRIGLTTYRGRGQMTIYDTEMAMLPAFYLEGVTRAGGLAILLPPQPLEPGDAKHMLEGLDGLIVCGGNDVNPELYGQKAGPHTEKPDPLRDLLEDQLLSAAIETGLPFLGICRGAQMLNVNRGGTLHQHLPDVVGHDRYRVGDGEFHAEPIEVDAGSKISELVDQDPAVWGKVYHHQAIDELGGGLRVTARGFDGVVQGIELEGHPFGLAVQWHPEQSLEDIRLFKGLVEAARANSAARSSTAGAPAAQAG